MSLDEMPADHLKTYIGFVSALKRFAMVAALILILMTIFLVD